MLASCQFLRGQNQPLDALACSNRVNELRHIGQSDVTVEKVIWLNQDRYPGRALIEATGGANPRLEFREPARFELFLQGSVDCLRAARRARSFFVTFGATIGANEKVALPLGHDRRLAVDGFRVNRPHPD